MNSIAKAGRRMLLVLGMHRSGTSAVAGTLAGLGVDFSAKLEAPAADNPKGFFEHVDVWRQDHQILAALGSAWDDPLALPSDWRDNAEIAAAAPYVQAILERDFGSATLAGIKDPRMCRLVPVWRTWLQAAGFATSAVLVVRWPAGVIASLARRDDLSAEQAAWVWLRHMLEAERDTRGLPRVVVTYEGLMRDWRAEATHIARALDINWPRSLADAGAAVDNFLEPALQHYRDAKDVVGLSKPLEDWVQRTYTAITREADTAAALDRVAAEVVHADLTAAAGAVVLRTVRRQQLELERKLEWVDNERRGLAAGNQELQDNLERHVSELALMKVGNQELQDNLERHVSELALMKVGTQQLRENLDRHVHALATAKAGSQELQERLDKRTTELEQTVAQVRAHEAMLAAVYASRSWRLTRPLRGLMRLARGDFSVLHRRRAAAARLHAAVTLAVPAHAPAVPLPAAPPVAQPAPPPPQPPLPQQPMLVLANPELDAVFAACTGPRILIVTPDVVGPIRNGGIGTAFAALAEALAGVGRAVTILYTLGGHTEGGEDIAAWVRDYAARGIRFVPIWLERGEPVLDAPHHAWRAYRVYLWLRQHQAEYDIAYFPEWKGEAYYALQAKRLGLEFARLCIVIVTHSSTTWADSGNYLVPKKFDDLLLEFQERRVVETADAVISPSQYMLDWMRRWGWQVPATARVLQNLMPAADLEPTPAHAAATAVNEFVFFGRLERRKGLVIFLAALAQLPAATRDRIQVTFLGKAIHTPDYDSAELIRSRFKGWRLPAKIVTGYNRDQALAYLHQPGRVAIIASLVENSPYTVLECVARRIPFLAANVGGIAELIHREDRAQALFKPNPADLAAALGTLETAQYRAPRAAQSQVAIRNRWVALQDELAAELATAPAALAVSAPHITVCLVHHDRPQLLAQAIDSLRQQTYAHFDVVLVDDGSTTGEAKQYLEALRDEFEWRGWTLVCQSNRYLGAARNAAARHAHGDFLLFMDDDNLAKPNELAVFARAACVSGADILTTVSDIFSDAEGVPQQGRVSRQLWIPLGNAVGLGVFRNVFGDANALIRRQTFLDLGGFTEDYGLGHEDWEFFARAVLGGANLQLVPEPLFWYRVDAKSMLRGGDPDLDRARSLRPYRELLPHGLGAALAYAARLHHSPSASSSTPVAPVAPRAPDLPSRQRRLWFMVTGVFRSSMRARFRVVLRESGWRGVATRALRVAKSAGPRA